jgi:monoamine oxidase
MKRRHFLKQSTLISLGGIFLPNAMLSACRKKTLFEDVKYDGKVLIIGAGAAGLYAGYLLKSKGINFEILEAFTMHGGRLGKLTGFANFPLDIGAQWLHGKNNILGDLITKSNTKIRIDDVDKKYWFNNAIKDSLPKDIEAIFLREDNLPDISFKDFAVQEGFGNEYNDIVESIAGDSGASASKISTLWKVKEEENWSSGDDDYKFEATYFDLIDKEIAQEVKDKIRLNTVVSKVDYSQSLIIVTDTNNNVYKGDKLIITVPISILKTGDIQFMPELSNAKTNAFSKIGMEAGMKVFLKFSEKFFDKNIVGGSICAFYADESIGKTQNDNVLLAFVMGQQAEYLTTLGSNAAITQALLKELDKMYNMQASKFYVSSHVQNYTTNPFIKGAYSYSTIGMGDARKTASETINKKLYFAGEAMNINGHHQTVHGAVETGYKVVIDILNDIKK